MELTEKVPASWPALAGILTQVPPSDVPTKLPPMLALRGNGRPEVAVLFDQWSQSTVSALKKAVSEARQVSS